MSFDTTLFVRDVEGSLAAVQGSHSGQLFAGNYTIHDATRTATASLTNGTSTTLHSGISGRYLDLVSVTLANSSDAAATVSLKDDSATVRTYTVPASNTLHVPYNPPVPQSATNSNWDADMADITGTTVTVNALFLLNR